MSGAAFGEEEADPAADWPGEQPGYPVPVGPARAPVGDGCGGAHEFSEDEEPEHVGGRRGGAPGMRRAQAQTIETTTKPAVLARRAGLEGTWPLVNSPGKMSERTSVIRSEDEHAPRVGR